jgi:hypothetical protein
MASSDTERPARIVWTFDNSSGEPTWSLIETMGSTLAAPIVQIWVPARKAEEVVKIITDAHRDLNRKLTTCAEVDPPWHEYTRRMGFPVEHLLRRRGRPSLTPKDRKMVRVVEYLHEGHSAEETALKFNIPKVSRVYEYEHKVKSLQLNGR